MSRTLIACAAFVALSSVALRADAVGPLPTTSSVTYETVDAVEVEGVWITVTGILVGDIAPARLGFKIAGAGQPASEAAASRCDRLALLAMSRPGKFLFNLTVSLLGGGSAVFSCKLVARTL